jgi:YfiR/HmsC-like
MLCRFADRVGRWFRSSTVALAIGGGVAILAASPAPSAPSAPDPSRYDEKAALVFEVIGFVGWPPAGDAAAAATFDIGVLGDELFSAALTREMAGKQVAGRAIRIRSFAHLDEVDPCPILVIGRGKARLLWVILEFLADSKGILTIGDSDDFALRGGVLRLIERPDRIAFEINREAAESAELQLSSQLLRLAERLLPADPVTTQ